MTAQNGAQTFTFTRLGRFGRFGNQLFQIAATIGIASRHNAEYIFPRWEFASFFRTVVPQSEVPIRPDLTISQDCFHYLDVRVDVPAAMVIDMRGAFQSERYFDDCAALVRDYFEPTPAILSALFAGYGNILRNEPTCIMVVRRGDYVTNQNNWVLQPAAFYAEAMAQFDQDTHFFVTSDDIQWCYEHIRAPHIVFLPQAAWPHNFFLGTLCQHAIIANSTFGWWFAYLSKNQEKRVIAAKNWFGPDLSHQDTKDLLPAGWIRL